MGPKVTLEGEARQCPGCRSSGRVPDSMPPHPSHPPSFSTDTSSPACSPHLCWPHSPGTRSPGGLDFQNSIQDCFSLGTTTSSNDCLLHHSVCAPHAPWPWVPSKLIPHQAWQERRKPTNSTSLPWATSSARPLLGDHLSLHEVSSMWPLQAQPGHCWLEGLLPCSAPHDGPRGTTLLSKHLGPETYSLVFPLGCVSHF